MGLQLRINIFAKPHALKQNLIFNSYTFKLYNIS